VRPLGVGVPATVPEPPPPTSRPAADEPGLAERVSELAAEVAELRGEVAGLRRLLEQLTG
jgi:hypothetical protein